MARLIIKTEGFARQALELRMGLNRVGRDPECELHIPHDSVSSVHGELALTSDGVHLQDCDSTNGTFVNGEPISEAWLLAGQEVRFGQVELLVESTDTVVAIPEFDRCAPVRAAILLENGRTACPEHPEIAATFRCPKCKEHMCNACVHAIRLQGRPPHFLCRLCSTPVERIDAGPPKKRKGFFARLQETVKLKFNRPADTEPK